MKLRMDNRPRRPAPPLPEHGDWRLPLDCPADAEHLPTLRPPLWRRVQLQARYWQEAEVSLEPPIIPISGWSRALRLLLSLIVLLPLSLVMVLALGLQLYQAAAPAIGKSSFWLSVPVWYTMVGLTGFVSLAVAKFFEPILVYIYVLGHESTHAVAALLSFGKINDFKFNVEGGYVETDADNIFIALSPYFVPFWMLVWMLGFWLANHFFPFEAYEPWFYGGLGFWWAFHLYWTFWVIPREQPDMLENGLLFSMLVIVLMNIVVLLGILWFFGAISPESYQACFMQSAQRIADTLSFAGGWLLEFISRLRG